MTYLTCPRCDKDAEFESTTCPECGADYAVEQCISCGEFMDPSDVNEAGVCLYCTGFA